MKQLLEDGASVFERRGKAKASEATADPDALHRKIGEPTMERDFLQEKLYRDIETVGPSIGNLTYCG